MCAHATRWVQRRFKLQTQPHIVRQWKHCGSSANESTQRLGACLSDLVSYLLLHFSDVVNRLTCGICEVQSFIGPTLCCSASSEAPLRAAGEQV